MGKPSEGFNAEFNPEFLAIQTISSSHTQMAMASLG